MASCQYTQPEEQLSAKSYNTQVVESLLRLLLALATPVGTGTTGGGATGKVGARISTGDMTGGEAVTTAGGGMGTGGPEESG